MKVNLAELKNNAKRQRKFHQKIISQLEKSKPAITDNLFAEAHAEAFDKIDCLQCANCCQTTSPIVTDRDISRIATHLRIKQGELVSRYLKIDEDGDYVMQQAPCPFLQPDNYCQIYEVRPRACSTFPHTDRKPMQPVLHLTLKNTPICPAVFYILEKIGRSINPL